MSEIDQYDHQCLGIVLCPSTYERLPGWNRQFALYRFDSDATDASDSFQAKRGDIIMGGGSGEWSAFRVSIPEAFRAFTHDDWDDWQRLDELVYAYWSVTDAFIFCEGFVKLGWQPTRQKFEFWLCEHIMAFLAREYRNLYGDLVGAIPIEQNGSIIHLPSEDELRILDWKQYR